MPAESLDRRVAGDLPLLRAAFEASGSGRWLMRAIVELGLDRSNGFRLQLDLADDQVQGGLQATEARLAAATAEVVDTDWLSIARCRRSGIPLAAAVPYGAIFGGLVARRDGISRLRWLADLPGRRIGVVHPDDKNWQLLRAACQLRHGFDPDTACTRFDAGSKTTLRQQLTSGTVDAALLYWHQVPALLATGDFVEVCDLLDLLPMLGVRTVPSTFFVFPDALLAARPDLVRGFGRAVQAAVRVLHEDAQVWHTVTGTAADDPAASSLRAKWLARVRSEWTTDMRTDLADLARFLGAAELPPGVFAPGFLSES